MRIRWLLLPCVLAGVARGDAYDTLVRRYEKQIEQQEKQLGTLRSRLVEKEKEASRWQGKAEEAHAQWSQAGAAVEKTRGAVQTVRDQLRKTSHLADAAEWSATEHALVAHATDEQMDSLAREVYIRKRASGGVVPVSIHDRRPELVLGGLAGFSTSAHQQATEAQAAEASLRTQELTFRQQEQQQAAELDRAHQKQQAQWLRWQEANQRRAALEEEKNQMEQSAQALRVMVQELRDHRDHAAAVRQGRVGDERALAGLRGTLPWPAEGKVTQGYGRQYSDELKQLLVSNGIKIEPGPDRNVRAVEPGKVLFASPFRQYGQLVIVQHHAGLASVYGGLGQIRVKEGDSVGPLDVIGTTGETGSFYFELRHEEQPVNPLVYLSPHHRSEISSRRKFQ